MSQADVEADATAALLLHHLGWPEARQPVVEGVAMPTPVVPLSGGARGDEEQMRRKEYKKENAKKLHEIRGGAFHTWAREVREVDRAIMFLRGTQTHTHASSRSTCAPARYVPVFDNYLPG